MALLPRIDTPGAAALVGAAGGSVVRRCDPRYPYYHFLPNPPPGMMKHRIQNTCEWSNKQKNLNITNINTTTQPPTLVCFMTWKIAIGGVWTSTASRSYSVRCAEGDYNSRGLWVGRRRWDMTGIGNGSCHYPAVTRFTRSRVSFLG